MQDRVSLYPGRVTLTPVEGQANTYDLVRADQPTQAGTPLNKASLLKDTTAALLKLGTDATPDDAFLALLVGAGKYGYRVKVQLSDGAPCAGAVVSGIDAIPGFNLTTGADGYVLGTSESASVFIGCTSPFVDQTPAAAQSVTGTGAVTDVVLTLRNNTAIIPVTTSGSLSVSPKAQTVDITAIGGGGGGGGGSSSSSGSGGGGGGGGGNVAVALGKTPKNTISVIIGAGGAAGAAQAGGGAGGTTTVTTGETSVSAAGGGGGNAGSASSSAGGSGNGPGGTGAITGTNGSAATAYLFNDISMGLAGGGGGGGGSIIGNGNAAGGTPYGGIGYGESVESSVKGPDAGTGPGGGGGGGGVWYSPAAGAAGYRGQVWLRFHF